MPYIKRSEPKSRTKSDIRREIDDYWSKNAHLWNPELYKSTKNAKNAKSTVKTAKNDKNSTKLVSNSAIKAYVDAQTPPVSTPDPNEAFRHKKRVLARITNELEWLDRHPDE